MSIIPGAVSVWSAEGLHTYRKYLINLYSDENKLRDYVVRYGGKMKDVGAPVELIQPFNGTKLHLSDMYTLQVFIKEMPSRRRAICEEMYLSEPMHCILKKTANSISQVSFIGGSAYNASNTPRTKYCLIHFQGELHKKSISMVINKLEQSLSNPTSIITMILS